MNGRIPNPGVRPLHQGQPVAHAGAVVSRAKVAMILLHGRGASAEDILSLAQAFAQPEMPISRLRLPGIAGIRIRFLRLSRITSRGFHRRCK